MSEKKLNSLQDLKSLKKTIRQTDLDKKEYQEFWKDNKYNFRKMVAKKNKRWLAENKEETEFHHYQESNKEIEVYRQIEGIFKYEKSRKFLIHTICNFFPLNNCRQVPRLSKENNTCDITNNLLTDLDEIKTGKNNSRKKHIAYTGNSTTVVLCGLAVQELERFVLHYVQDFDSPFGHIINHALDEIRSKK